MNNGNYNKNHNQSIKKNQKEVLGRIMIILLIPTIVVLISFSIFRPKATVNTDNTEVLKLATILKEEGYSAKGSEEILSNAYHKYYINCSDNELLIGVYQSNGEVKPIKTIVYDN